MKMIVDTFMNADSGKPVLSLKMRLYARQRSVAQKPTKNPVIRAW